MMTDQGTARAEELLQRLVNHTTWEGFAETVAEAKAYLASRSGERPSLADSPEAVEAVRSFSGVKDNTGDGACPYCGAGLPFHKEGCVPVAKCSHCGIVSATNDALNPMLHFVATGIQKDHPATIEYWFHDLCRPQWLRAAERVSGKESR